MPAPTTKNRKQKSTGRFYDIDGEDLPSVTNILTCIGKPALIQWAAKEERELVLKEAEILYADIAVMEPRLTPLAWTTTILARLGKTRANQRLLKKAGDIGTEAHELIQWELQKGLGAVAEAPTITHDVATWAYMAWQDWAKSVRLKPKFIEQVVFSKVHGFAGTMDLFCEVYVPGLKDYFIKKKLEIPESIVSEKREWISALADWKTGKAIYPESDLQNAAYRFAMDEMGHGTADIGLIVRLPKLETDPQFEVAVVGAVEPLMKVFLATKTLWTWTQIAEKAYQDRIEKAKEPVTEKLSSLAPIDVRTDPKPAATDPRVEKIKQIRRTRTGKPMAVIPPLTEAEKKMGMR